MGKDTMGNKSVARIFLSFLRVPAVVESSTPTIPRPPQWAANPPLRQNKRNPCRFSG